MGYIYVEKDGVQAQYLITSTAVQPRLVVSELGYVPLVMGTTNAPMIKYAPADGYETLRAGSYTSTTVKSTSSSVGSSSVGCAGTSSSSGSTLNTTIQASTAISFTSTSAFTRVSTSGYNGLSNAQAQTCESTSSWAGMSTKQSNYQTTLANSAGLSSTTALTRESISGYSYPTAYKITQTWYNSPTRTIGYSGISAFTSNAPFHVSMRMYEGYHNDAWGDTSCYASATYIDEPYDIHLSDTKYNAANIPITLDVNSTRTSTRDWETDMPSCAWYAWKGFCGNAVFIIGRYANSAQGFDYWNATTEGGGSSEGTSYEFTFTGYRNATKTYTSYTHNANGAGLSSATALTETYIDYSNPQYNYGWVTTATVPLTRASTSSWKGISSKVSSYITTLANSAGLSNVTGLTRSSTSAYSGISCSRSDYYGTQVNSNGMTNATAMTRESIYGYSGVTSRSSPYNTTSNAVGNLSYTTALTRESVSAYSGLSTSQTSYNLTQTDRTITAVHFVVFTHNTSTADNEYQYGYNYVTTTRINGRSFDVYRIGNDGYSKRDGYCPKDSRGSTWLYYWDEYNDAGQFMGSSAFSLSNSRADVYNYSTAAIPGGYSYLGVLESGYYEEFGRTQSFFVSAKTGYKTSSSIGSYYTTSPSTAGLSNITNLTRASVSGYSGQLSQQSNYYVTKENSAGLSNVTTLTRSSTSGYTGVLSRTSSYETLIPNDGQNALVAQALTCSSTSEWGGKSSTSESISSTELRTSYFTSGYTESTTISVTDRVLTTTIYSDTVTIQSSSLSSGNGYKIVGGAIVVDQGGYDYYTVESYSTYEQSTFVVVAESMETTTLRTGTYTRTSQAIMSYGARTSLSTYINTNTYIETIWGYM